MHIVQFDNVSKIYKAGDHELRAHRGAQVIDEQKIAKMVMAGGSL